VRQIILHGKTLRKDDLWVAVIEEMDGVHGIGTTREEAIEDAKVSFANCVVERRRENELMAELVVEWI
jgi:predicted RNase H-like HicB family nuclease